MRAYNKRLKHTTAVKAIDFMKGTVKLELPDSRPVFIYEESLNNVDILDATGVVLDNEMIYVGDILTDLQGRKLRVEKVPGGYFPFMEPVRENFKKDKNGM